MLDRAIMGIEFTRRPTVDERRLLAHLDEHGALLPQDSYQPSLETVGSCLAAGWARSFADAGGYLVISALGRRVLAALEAYERAMMN